MFAFAKGALSTEPGVTPPGFLHRNGRFDRWMWLVPDEFEIFEFETVDVFDGRIQFHSRQRPAISRELFARLIEVVVVKMQIAKSVNKIARREIDDLRHHHREKRVRRNVERHTQEKIAAALVQLTT